MTTVSFGTHLAVVWSACWISHQFITGIKLPQPVIASPLAAGTTTPIPGVGSRKNSQGQG